MEHEPPFSARGPQDLRPRKPVILIADADQDLRAQLAALLEQQGFGVLSAEGGAQALAFMLDEPGIDLVLLDLWMPDMDGWSFRIEQRKTPHIADVPVIVVTADQSQQARAIDADAFVQKPFDPDHLTRTIRHVIAERRSASAGVATMLSQAVAHVAGAICHEIANPLMAIIGGLERLGSSRTAGGDPDHTVRAATAEMLDQCWRIAGALRTLRDLPSPVAGHERDLDLVQIVRAAIAWTNGRGVTLHSAPGDPVLVRADPVVLAYVCTAVLHNAVESIPRARLEQGAGDPSVEVRVSRVGSEAVLDVRDRGGVIPHEELRRVFNVEYPGRTRAWATGLRLWFVRQAVLGLGGSVEVANDGFQSVRCRIRIPSASKATYRPPAKVREGELLRREAEGNM